ncbi:MAG TPA: hypothetical protein VFY82_10215 [Acidimicrobiales bacterium]|nr:hypothetical protein [Acidimicrobiales bacterium]
MAALSFRDRLLTRRGARAITSPVGVVGGIVVAAAATVAGLPMVAAVPLGVVAWAVNGWRLLPRAPRPERIDPFTLQEPWRRAVQNALQARNRYAEAVTRVQAGPLRDRLDEIGERMQTGVEECWQIARRGQALARARRGIDLAAVERRLAQAGADPGQIGTRGTGAGAGDQIGTGATGAQVPASGGDAAPPVPSQPAVVESLQVQRATALRLDEVIDSAEAQLRLLGARLDEAVARTLELSAHAGTEAGAVTGLGDDVDSLVSEMESLRLALEETGTTR